MTQAFKAKHPMFQYQTDAVPEKFQTKLEKFDRIVVIGMGGSVLPLKALVDAAELGEQIQFLDTVDPRAFEKIATDDPKTGFCVVSKSGETLEIKALLSEVIDRGWKDRLLVVTDPERGSLRKWADSEELATCPVPQEIGGRFTNFCAFHRAIFEKFSQPFEAWLALAQKKVAELKAEPQVLEQLFQLFFEEQRPNLILWVYGQRLHSFAYWMQQAIAESLGKVTEGGKRVGVFPIVLRGPEDQHSVLQLLRDGPQRQSLFFISEDIDHRSAATSRKLPEFCKDLETKSLKQVHSILEDATYQSFEERIKKPELSQNLLRWKLSPESLVEEVTKATVMIQAFVEYAGLRLGIEAFDQPGVDRGKQLARALLSA